MYYLFRAEDRDVWIANEVRGIERDDVAYAVPGHGSNKTCIVSVSPFHVVIAYEVFPERQYRSLIPE